MNSGVAAPVPEHVQMCLEAELVLSPARSIVRAKPAVLKGAPRSVANAKGDLGSSARAGAAAAPVGIGWVLGVPCLTLRWPFGRAPRIDQPGNRPDPNLEKGQQRSLLSHKGLQFGAAGNNGTESSEGLAKSLIGGCPCLAVLAQSSNRSLSSASM